MYLKKLETWDKRDWESFFSQFNLTTDQEVTLKQILTLERKEDIETHFPYLRITGVLNGIGPGYAGKFFRNRISNIFRGVRYEWHDINYAIGGGFKDRMRADYGLLKYSCITIRDTFKRGLEFDISRLLSPIFMLILSIFLAIQFCMALFCYVMVVLFGGIGSFRYLK